MDTKIETLLSQLTLAEKAALTVGRNNWQTVAVERLGIPAVTTSDGPHGVRRVQNLGEKHSVPATCFPTASALAATWDRDLLYELGQALAQECLALGVDVLLGPGVNMKRTPLCGRNFEYFSEDPYLAGELAVNWIEGLQSKGVGASLKHFAANNQETHRMTVNASIDERTLHEIYLSAFERAVRQAQPWTVMCAYNRLNGTYCSEHKALLTEILRDRWGFEGLVVSDWGAVHNRERALQAGLDLEMPGPQPRRVEAVVQAVQAGDVDEELLDRAVSRVLELAFKTAGTPKGGETVDAAAHHALARRIAGEAIVLLKNEGDLLPLRNVARLAVIGAAAQEPSIQGLGSSRVNPVQVDIPLAEIEKQADDIEVHYFEGYRITGEADPDLAAAAVAGAAAADAAVLFIALPPEAEAYDRPHIDLPEAQVKLIRAVAEAQPRCVVVVNNGAAVAMEPWIEFPAAVLEAWLMGQAGGGAVADVLFGRVNPSGRLAETFPRRLNDTPAYLNYPGEIGQVRYGEGLYIGYRYYDAKKMDVLFPFGFGLSYTSFELANLRLDASLIGERDELALTVDVTNTGQVTGKTVVQVYVHDVEAELARPEKELKGFVKVALEPGETREVTVRLEPRAFAYYHPGRGGWVIENGQFDILVGQSAAGPFLRAPVQVQAEKLSPRPLTMDSTIREWLEHPAGGSVLLGYFQEMLGGGGGERFSTSFDSLAEAIEEAKVLTLETALVFWGGELSSAPEDVARQLVDRANEASSS